MGQRASNTAGVTFEDVVVPEEVGQYNCTNSTTPLPLLSVSRSEPLSVVSCVVDGWTDRGCLILQIL